MDDRNFTSNVFLRYSTRKIDTSIVSRIDSGEIPWNDREIKCYSPLENGTVQRES